MYKTFLLIIFMMILHNYACTQIVAPNATLHKINSRFAFAEGATTDSEGNVFFTDQPNNNIWKYDTKGKLTLFMHGTKRSNGMYMDAKGNLISCADEKEELISISPDKKITVLVNNYKGHTLNGPNDVWVNRLTGGMYISDPYFQRDYWKRQHPDSALGGEKVYYLPPGSHQLIRQDSTIQKPNGIVGTPDGKYLYVADMGTWKTYRYRIAEDGSLTGKELFANEASDGMTLDERGNVYLTGKGVIVYNSEGKKIAHIDVPEDWTGNLCFCGIHKNILFITASKSVYTIETVMKGVE